MRAGNASLAWTIQTWLSFLQDEAVLLNRSGAHHKVLAEEAHALYRSHLIDRNGLSELLEQAVSALAYVGEAFLNEPRDE